MSSVGLNQWIVSGNLAADAEIKTVDLKNGEKAKVAEATMYVRKPRSRDDSFTVRLSIWETSAAWRKLPYLKKGSLIICTGNVEPSPYISNSDNKPKAGLRMNVVDIDLDNVRNAEDEEVTVSGEATQAPVEKATPEKMMPEQVTQPVETTSSANGKSPKSKTSSETPQATEAKVPVKA